MTMQPPLMKVEGRMVGVGRGERFYLVFEMTSRSHYFVIITS